MAYAQNIQIRISPEGFNCTIKNVDLKWGKFYKDRDKDAEIPVDEIDGMFIENMQSKFINSCGRSDASSGTEGSIELYDGDIFVGNFVWDCPWGTKNNSFGWSKHNNNYITELSGGNIKAGSIGLVEILSIKRRK